MFTTILSLLSSAFSAIKLNWIPYVIIAVVGLALLAALWRIDNLSGAVALERSEHAATKEALAHEVEKGMGWKTAYEEALNAADAQWEVAQACLDRELAAREAYQERTAILQAAPPRPRTETEQQQVVDDETRKRAADRLNRPF